MPAPTSSERGERLQKVMASAGVASRRACEAYITAGRVRVNGQVVTELGARVDPEHDRIEVDGRPLTTGRERAYYLVYKPVGHVSTADDPQGRPTVVDLAPGQRRLYPVGRLDRDSEGLVLLTDDGELTQRLLHPRYEHDREYLALVQGRLSAEEMRRMAEGLHLPDEERPVRARVSDASGAGHLASSTTLKCPAPKADEQWLRVILREGRKRQIRRMMQVLGHEVKRLIRVRMASLRLGDLRPGEGRWLTDQEIAALRRDAGLE
jgi:23S rRNA pseudouridine2605 synthase